MRDLPILFSGVMVRAILREIEEPGTGKTQTRRVLTSACDEPPAFVDDGIVTALDENGRPYRWPRTNAVGDCLYVREAWHAARSLDKTPPREISHDADIEYAATARSYAEIGLKGKLRPAMFLPRWASRITLTVSDVRVQRLQEISEADATAEGAVQPWTGSAGTACDDTRTALSEFEALWDSLNASRGCGWDANPWVAAYTFRPILGNIDEVQP